MKISVIIPLLLFSVGLNCSAAITETAGVTIFEAEEFATNLSPRGAQSWVLSNSVVGFSGSGYMEAVPNLGTNITANWLTTSPELQFPLNFTMSGTHYVWIRGYAVSNTDDSIHAGLDSTTNTSSAITLTQYGAWQWTTNTVTGGARPFVTGGTGSHSFSLWMREDGMRVDRVLLTTNASLQAQIGNCWHIPSNPEAVVALPSMRVPLNGITPNVTVTIYNGNQYQGAGNAADQAQTGSTIFYRRIGETNWSSLPMYFFGAGGNNKYFSNSIPAGTFTAGDVVQYYLRIWYTDRLPTFVYGNDNLSLTTEIESIAQSDPFSFDVQQPLQASGGFLAITNFSSDGLLIGHIHTNSGHISIIGPDLAGNPSANEIMLAPPSVTLGGEGHQIGRVLSAISLPNGLELVQQLSSTSIVARLTFTGDGVMRYEVVNWNGVPVDATAISAASDSNEHFYGFGEKFNEFDQSGKKVHILTFDQAGDKQDYSYKVAPWFVSTRGFGFHLDSSAESFFDMRAQAADRFTVSNLFSSLKFNIVYGPRLTHVLSRYTGYTGRASLPPSWAFAPWLSSDVWHNGGEVRYVVTKYRSLGLPGSVFVYDSPWETAYNDFAWNMTQFGAAGNYEGTNWNGFASPGEMMTFLRTNGFKVVCWMTPFVNLTSNNENIPGQNLGQASNYSIAQANNYFVRASPGGAPLVVSWWKGTGSPIDFTNPDARAWTTAQLSNLVAQSGGVIAGFKTDDGESSSADGNNYIPTTASYFDGRSGIEMRNGYCVEYHKTIWNVLGTNGLLFARSGFTGTQAFPACWAGDNQPNFGSNGLPGVIIAGQSAAMSGYAIWAHDICGYLDNNFSSALENLFMRWTQFGAFSPIMQMHRQVGANLQYPWSFGADGLANYQFYTRLHTALFPYIYSYAKEASTNGIPILRPLVLLNQEDPNTYGIRHSYQFGNELLVAAVVTNVAATRTVYLPQGNWIDYFTGQHYAGGQNINWTNANQFQFPLFARDGAIIPMISTNVQTLCDSAYVANPALTVMSNSLEFLVYPSTNSSFTVYDGTSAQCQSNGTVATFSISSVARPILVRLVTGAPFSVEQDGVKLSRMTNAVDLAAGTSGWFHDGTILLIKCLHPGGFSQVTFSPDSVGDGISDAWRSRFFGSTTTNSTSCAICDADTDGLNNLQEFYAGTNPTDATSTFRITTLNSGARIIQWNSISGRSYQVYATTNLATPFVPISGNVLASSALTQFIDNNGGAQKFYRIAIQP